MKEHETTRKAILKVTTVAGGILVLVLFRWIPATGMGMLLYALLLVVLVITAILLSRYGEQNE